MLLTLTTTHRPATDLGYLLHKNPARVQSVELSFGAAHVFYPEAEPGRCTAALLLDVDPVGLVRDRTGPAGNDLLLARYVNDRPYVASSFMSVALARAFGTAMGGRSKERPELAATPIPLRAELPVVPCRGGEGLVRRLFEPLGYAVSAKPLPLDPRFPAWGASSYVRLACQATVRLADLLAHLYVLLPVLDDDKHYWVGADEIDKLQRRGGEWLAAHPERDLVVRRYLVHDRRLTREALARITDEDQADPDRVEAQHDRAEEEVEERISLAEQRLGSVVAVLRAAGAHRILDLGCGSGKLLAALLRDGQFTEVLGVDVSFRALEAAARRLHLDRMAPAQRARVRLEQGSLTYQDERLAGWDAAAVVEVVEHLDPGRLATFEQVLFGAARPPTVVVTTPNVEYNPRFGLPAGTLRHRDHRFEWTRAEFRAWAEAVAAGHGYAVRFLPVGPEDPEAGPPTQMGVFQR
ncbi:MAG TPA: 3' terminal RNA ribose 2'-O-methyltransferase Hen1 [Actinomycetes bacterium]|jgi:3' terminal RNA ribose 2'-O-methyltransferase Hen1|nr:3' terminal RNA ribose 2'-O-methyltransferase Hen1 [Actinomycetes bacterium]